jgi:predicted phosphoribosyltransferase
MLRARPPRDPAFADRRDGGRRLAERLGSVVAGNALVVALPRGGVPVGFEVAAALGAPLDVLAARKLGTPANPELAVGAIAEGGVAVLDSAAARRFGVTQAELDATVERETQELHRRVERYRDGQPPLEVRGRTAVLVDDGLATGLTALAAVRALRAREAGRVVLAVPVGAAPSLELLAAEADEVVCHTVAADLLAVGYWYADFAPVSDDEVVELLRESAARALPALGGSTGA